MKCTTCGPGKVVRPLPRRAFCKHVAIGIFASLVGGKFVVRNVLAEDNKKTSDVPGTFILNLEEIPDLAETNGSVVMLMPGAPDLLAPVVVTRGAGDTFFAVDSTCTHQQCMVMPFDAEAGHIECGCHGSKFQMNGELLDGPAERNLRAFVASLVSPNQLQIIIPEFQFITQVSVMEDQQRLRLQFPALAFLTYVVQFRATIEEEWKPVSFARFDGGSFDSTDLLGNGSDVEVFVQITDPTGFFKVVAS